MEKITKEGMLAIVPEKGKSLLERREGRKPRTKRGETCNKKREAGGRGQGKGTSLTGV